MMIDHSLYMWSDALKNVIGKTFWLYTLVFNYRVEDFFLLDQEFNGVFG